MKYTRRNIYRHLNEKISFSKKLMIIGGICALFCVIAIPIMNELKNAATYLIINNIMYFSTV